jgi:hypothetical protein
VPGICFFCALAHVRSQEWLATLPDITRFGPSGHIEEAQSNVDSDSDDLHSYGNRLRHWRAHIQGPGPWNDTNPPLTSDELAD